MEENNSFSLLEKAKIEKEIKDIVNDENFIENIKKFRGNTFLENLENCTDFHEIIKDIISNKTVQQMHTYVQHGEISCFMHCYYVAYCTYLICKKLNLDYKSATRGAMLHDLFLYDWHLQKPADVNEKGLHAFVHPQIALKNASKLFELNNTEKDVILNHMWPVTIKVPKTKEAFIVSCLDKYSATIETYINCKNKFQTSRIYKYAYLFVGLMIFRIF